MFTFAERFGLFQHPADIEQEWHNQTADYKRDTPAPLRHRLFRQQMIQHKTQQSSKDDRNLLAARLPADEKAFASFGRDFGQIDRHATQLNARREALQQPSHQDQNRRCHAQGGIARHQRDGQGTHRH